MADARSQLLRRPITILAASFLLGAGGGAGTALALNHGGTKTVERMTAASPTRESAAVRSTNELTVNEIYRQTSAGVVEVTVTQPGAKAEGSGFVIDKGGDIVTNQHVVNGGGSIHVQFSNGRTASAHLIGQDRSGDIAVIRVSVPASQLHPLTFGDSSKVQVGDGVVAIGSPFGLSGSVTTGIVSALDRSITAPNRYTITGAIQTDAPINRGNSGGPLLDSHGEVIGVNSQIDSQSGDSSGVGFAVSSNRARTVAQDLIAGKKVQHPYLGVSLVDASGGAGIGSVTDGSPAARAGLSAGDVITAIGGHRIRSADDAVAAIDGHAPGDHLKLTFERGGQNRTVSLTLAERPS
jgi:putative serine protease PepD